MIFHFDTATILALLVSIVIPLVSTLLMKAHWPVDVMSYLTIVLAAINGFVTEWAQSPNANHYDWKTAVGISLSSLVVALISRRGLWVGTKTDAKLAAVGSKAA